MFAVSFINKHVQDIKKYGLKEFFRKLSVLLNNFFYFPSLILGFFLFIIIWLLSPILLIRVNKLISQRLGHYLTEVELYLAEQEKSLNYGSKNKCLDLFYYDGPISNTYVHKIVKKKIIILPKILLMPIHMINKFFNKLLKKLDLSSQPIKFIIPRPLCQDRDVRGMLNKTNQKIKIFDEDIKLGQETLLKLGVKSDKYVCLAVRDSGYLDSVFPKGHWRYLDYRNGNIEKYILAAEELTKRGYYVLRMGKFNKKRLISNNPMIIDYSFSEHRSDFMDIFLGGNCSFCISTGFGFDSIPLVFRRPIAYVYAPIGYLFSFTKNSTAIFKKYYSLTENRFLKIKEIFLKELAYNFNNSLTNVNSLTNKNILLVENSPEEIRELVIEMDKKCVNDWLISEEEKLLQIKFWDFFLKSSKEKNYDYLHGIVNMEICTSFLKLHKELYIDE